MDLIHLDFHGVGDKLPHIIIYCLSWRRKYKHKVYKVINLMALFFVSFFLTLFTFLLLLSSLFQRGYYV